MGDRVPADVRFVDVSTDAKFDRSILTGMPQASLTESGLAADCNAQANLCLCTAQLIQQTPTTSRRRALGWLELMSLRAAP
jgi:sodium/potassium-transporting ATPase subunit alpha